QLMKDDYATAERILNDFPVLSQALLKAAKVFHGIAHPEEQMDIANDSDFNQFVGEGGELSADLMNKILALTPEQIQNLPVEQRNTVMQIMQQQVATLQGQN